MASLRRLVALREELDAIIEARSRKEPRVTREMVRRAHVHYLRVLGGVERSMRPETAVIHPSEHPRVVAADARFQRLHDAYRKRTGRAFRSRYYS